MTKDILRMAREASINLDEGFFYTADMGVRDIEMVRFAQLVAAQEREQCAKLAKSLWYIDGQYTADEFAEAIRNRGNA